MKKTNKQTNKQNLSSGILARERREIIICDVNTSTCTSISVALVSRLSDSQRILTQVISSRGAFGKRSGVTAPLRQK